MFIRNNKVFQFLSLLIIFFNLGIYTFAQESNEFGFKSAKGMQIKILTTPTINFTHADLLIFFKESSNPSISYLAIENMFNKDIHDSDSNLISILKRLGNDYQIEQRVDYLKISINFLSDRISLFTHFLDELYRYKSFGLKRYNRSIFNFWNYFKKKQNWEEKLAQQYAYAHLFPDHILGNTVINTESLIKINLAQIRSFYQKTFRLENSILFLKGDLNPHITFGLIEKSLKSYKKKERTESLPDKLSVGYYRKLVLLDIMSNESPIIFWYQAIPPYGDPEHMLWVIFNNILFDYPFGELFKRASFSGIRDIRKIDSEIIDHSQVSIICNTIKLNYSDIEKFILMADNEVRKLGKRKIGRKEFLDSLNYFLGKSKVDSMDFDYEIEENIRKTILNLPGKSVFASLQLFQQISMTDLNQFVGNFGGLIRNNSIFKNPEIIVIVGNARLIKGYLSILRPDYIYSFQ